MKFHNPFSANTLWIIGLILISFPVNEFNAPIFRSLNSIHSNLSDLFWISMTTMGDGLLLGIILGMFIIVNPRITVFGLILLLAASFSVNLIKALLPALRPAEALGNIHIVGPVLRSGSFPSGHSAAAFAACLALSHFSPSRTFKFVLLFFGLLVGVSRIFVGAHFPNDVIWGIIVASLAYELLVCWIWPVIERYVPEVPPLQNRIFQSLIVVQIVTSLFCLTIYSLSFAEYPPAAIAVSTGVLTFFVIELSKSLRN